MQERKPHQGWWRSTPKSKPDRYSERRDWGAPSSARQAAMQKSEGTTEAYRDFEP